MYLKRKGLGNFNCRYYKFEHAPTWRRTTKDHHVLYQVVYGFWKAFPDEGDLIRYVMERSD